MLVEYNYLLAADQIDCSIYFPSEETIFKMRQPYYFDDDDDSDFNSGEELPSYP